MNILNVKSIKPTHILCVRCSFWRFLPFEASLSITVIPVETKSRLHTPISTVVHVEVVCILKILPIGIFLSHTLRSKIIAPWDMSQYQNSPRISQETTTDTQDVSKF